MFMSVLLFAALATAAWALWSRRATVGCRWEGAPTLVIGSAAAGAYLTSPYCKGWVGNGLHDLTGRWNDEDLIGYLCGIVCCATVVYMCLVRLGNAEMVRKFYRRRVILPLIVILPAIIAAFELGSAGEAHVAYIEDIEAPMISWATAGWILYCSTNVYLLLIATRLAWRLRQIYRPQTTVLNMYLIAFALTIGFFILIGVHAISRYDIRDIAWTLSYAAVILFAVTPAYSWKLRSRPLRLIAPKVPSDVD